jgi:oligosaccharide amylase
MPRMLAVGNGKLLVNMDERLQVRDIYYPYVGHQNHVQGHVNRVGVWIDGSFTWLSSKDWEIQPDYHQESLVTFSQAFHREMQVSLIFEDGVHQRENIFIRRITVENHSGYEREVRLFFHQDLTIYETEVGDTVFYEPKLKVIVHYKRNRYFLFNGLFDESGINQYTTGIKRFQSAEGTWRDAEDGHLHQNPIAQGSIDSTFSVESTLQPNEVKSAFFWMTVGKTLEEVTNLNDYIVDTGASLMVDKVMIYWNRWVNKASLSNHDLSKKMIDLYKRSLLIIRTQTNLNGYIMAANDSDILQYNRDHYSYMWPRDGALVAAAVTKAGYQGMVKNFYRRCSEILSKEGYLPHKFNPDGSIGSSWHPFVGADNQVQLPIQEDETALVLWAFWEHYQVTGDIEFAQSLYRSLVRPAAKFLLKYFDDELNLPIPSYDLWEERRGVFAFTCSAVYGGLMAAHNFALLFGDDERSERYKLGAEKVKEGIETYLYDHSQKRFIRGIYLNRNSREITSDYTVESSLFGLFALGVFLPNDPRIEQTMKSIEKELAVKTEIGGIARYFNDYYFQQTHDIERVPGNPWIICTLWIAKWKILKAEKKEELEEARKMIDWVVNHSLKSGLLPEQMHPFTGEPLSVAPLTWSHATYVDIVQDYLQAYGRLS